MWSVETQEDPKRVAVVSDYTDELIKTYEPNQYGLARANALVKALDISTTAAVAAAVEEVDRTHEWLEAIDMLRLMLDTFAGGAGGTSKATAQQVGYVLEAKIHEAFTTASDQLFMRGYLAKDERIALSGIIGDILGSFSEQVGTRMLVDAKDVVDIANKGHRASNDITNLQVLYKETSLPRWLIVSSCNYQDRDKQFVSEEGLRKAVLIGDLTGARGPLRWWHTKTKGKTLDLGTCDMQLVYKGFLIESGTFVSKAVAEAVSRVASRLRVSLGFIHPRSEPDQSGVFRNIAILERSLLPSGAESNPFTSLTLV